MANVFILLLHCIYFSFCTTGVFVYYMCMDWDCVHVCIYCGYLLRLRSCLQFQSMTADHEVRQIANKWYKHFKNMTRASDTLSEEEARQMGKYRAGAGC